MTSSTHKLGDSVHFGVKWLGIAMGSEQVVRLGTTVVLARLLAKEHFGLVALATTSIDAIAALREMGFSQALMRRRSASVEEDHLVADTAFWILQSMNVVLFAVGWMLAPRMPAFFPRVEGLEPTIVRALLFMFLVDGLSSISAALLQKRMAFDGLAKNEIRSTLVYAGLSTALAAFGFGAWSIIWGQIVSRLTMISGLVRMSGWWPRLRFDRAIALELFRFGRWLWGGSLFQAATRSVDKLILGKLSNGATLGSYSLAYNVCTTPAKPATSILVRVALPAMSAIQDDRPAVARAYARGLALASFLALPATAGMVVVASDFVRSVYGEKWSDMAVLVRILPLFGLATILGAISGPLLLALNRPKVILFVQTGRQVVFFGLLALLARHGAVGMAWSVVLPTVGALVAGHVCAARACGARPVELVTLLARTLAATGAMAASVLAFALLIDPLGPPILALALKVIVGLASYATASWWWNRDACQDAYAQVRRLLRSRGTASAPGTAPEPVVEPPSVA